MIMLMMLGVCMFVIRDKRKDVRGIDDARHSLL